MESEEQMRYPPSGFGCGANREIDTGPMSYSPYTTQIEISQRTIIVQSMSRSFKVLCFFWILPVMCCISVCDCKKTVKVIVSQRNS